MEILLLAHNYADNNANAFRYRELAKALSALGNETDIIGARKLNNELQLQNVNYHPLTKSVSFKSFFKIIPLIIRKGLFEFKCLHSIKGFTHDLIWASLAEYEINRLLKNKRYDISIISVVPWTYYAFSKILSRYSSLIIDISDPLYKNAFTNKDGDNRLIKFEKSALDHASKVIVMSEPLIDMYIKEIGVDPDKISFISPSTDISGYRPGNKYVYELPGKISLLYAGSIYPQYRDLEQLIPAVMQDRSLELTVISYRSQKPKENISYRSWVPKNQLIDLYEKSDVIVFIDNFFGYQVPSKIFEIIATNKPVLFIYDGRNTYLYNLLKGQKGIFFSLNNSEEICKTINHIKSLESIEVEYTFDLTPFSFKYMCGQMVKVLEEAIK